MPTSVIFLYLFLWGYVRTRPANTDDLKQHMRQSIQGIRKEMLQCVMTSCPSQLQECNDQHGGHLQSVMFKK